MLEKPLAPLSVFISYKRDESSAFALLLQCRLRSVGLDPFLDLNIAPGEDWSMYLEDRIQQSAYFISLLGPTTLDSPYVRQEIVWALENGPRTIIPVWHNSFSDQDDHPELKEALSRNAIIVENENVEAYNNAVNKLLNFLGYMPV